MTEMVIGIDPDLKENGVGIVSSGQLVDMQALDFFKLQTFIQEQHAKGAHFAVENVSVNKPRFMRALKAGSYNAQNDKISQNVGMVKAVQVLIVQFLDLIGASYTLVKPLGGTAKAAKKDAKLFNRMTGWTGRSSADKRDAAMLALYVARRKPCVRQN